jgi:hypothetical protein
LLVATGILVAGRRHLVRADGTAEHMQEVAEAIAMGDTD